MHQPRHRLAEKPDRWPRHRRVRDLEAVYRGQAIVPISGEAPRVVIVGAGLAGLVAAHVLRLGGCTPTVFDAAPQTGGRIRTDHGTLVPGMVTELGGEFIDSAHADMIALARTFNGTPIDLESRSEADLAVITRIGGQLYTPAEMHRAFMPFAARIRAHAAMLSTRITRRQHTEVDRRFDRMSIDAYLASIGMDGWLRHRICSGYTSLNGLDSAGQSSLNLLKQMGTDPAQGFSIFSHSDERWKLAEGLDLIVRSLSGCQANQVHTGHRLLRIRREGATKRLDFQTPGKVMSCSADAVVLALPFTLLRQVDARGVFSPSKQHAIDTLAYGTNSKVLVGANRKVWREQGATGDLCTEGLLQCGWDGSRMRPGGHGVYTFYMGGRTGLQIGEGDAHAQAQRLSSEASNIWPGFSTSLNGQVIRVHWPTEPWAQASYSTYATGQRTELAGDEAVPEDGIYFAGEHCAGLWQGYMQGAAATGRRSAAAILRRAGGAVLTQHPDKKNP